MLPHQNKVPTISPFLMMTSCDVNSLSHSLVIFMLHSLACLDDLHSHTLQALLFLSLHLHCSIPTSTVCPKKMHDVMMECNANDVNVMQSKAN